ncbi:MAG TPA: hypothetical protein VN026_09525 [Bacteroidia bacterium]|jgi:hypothetical protein|nr:hypothetical protein [Bacteroidia bacterium]
MNNIKIDTKTNLIGQPDHKNFLELQTSYGIAQRGGVKFPSFSDNHSKRITADVNLLSKAETKQLIFNETIYSN